MFCSFNKLSVITRDNSFDTFLPSHLFYYCWHYLEKNFPFLVALQEEAYGGMKLMHDNDYHSFVKSVAAVKASTWNSDMFSHDIEINEIGARTILIRDIHLEICTIGWKLLNQRNIMYWIRVQ